MKNQKIKRMAAIALLMALVVVMQFVSGLIPPVSGFSISLVLIPIVLGAALYGPSAGAVLGATFGTIVYINCVTGADVGGAMVFQANPVLCFVVVMGKGILCGAVPGLVYKVLCHKNAYIAMLCSAIICPVVNTGVFLIGCRLFFWETICQWGAASGFENVAGYMIFGLTGVNFLIELGVNLVLAPVITRLIRLGNQ